MDQNRLGLLLSALYSSADSSSIHMASEELKKWQQSNDAWLQSDQLMSTPGMQSEFYYFFAQTLKTKIQYDIYQLPTSSIIGLRDSIVQKLILFTNNSSAKATKKQLCLAIADLTIQASEVWSSAIPDIVNLLQAEHPVELLDILKLIPEETENLKLMTENSKRNLSRQRCLEQYYAVLRLLDNQFISTPPTDVNSAVLECFLAWMKFDSPPIQYSLVDSPIINYCLKELSGINKDSISVNETVIEILTEIVETSASFRNRNQHNPLIELKVYPQLINVCQILLETNLEQELASDEESLKVITRLLVVTGEGMMNKISNEFMSNSSIQQLLLLIIRLFGLKCIDISQICCSVFEDFLRITSQAEPRQSSPVHDRLFEALVVRLDIANEPSYNGVDPFGDVDTDFFHFRTSAILPLLYSLSRDFLGKSVGCERLARGIVHNTANATVQEAFAMVLKDQLGGVSEPTETAKSAVGALIDFLPRWIDVNTIHSCTLVDAFKRRSLIAMVGSLGSWIQSNDQLFAIVDLVAQVLIRPVVAHRSLHFAAANSFRDLCFNNHCKSMIVSNPGAIESITKLFNQTIGHLQMREHSILTEGITTILSSCSDDSLFNNLMRNMVLVPLAESGESFRSKSDLANTGLVIDRIMGVMRSMHKLRPGSSRYTLMGEIVANNLWPMISASMETFRAEAELVEKACRLVKHTLRCVPDVFKNLVVPLGRILVRDFSITQHSSYLYTAEVLAQEYGQDVEVRGPLGELFTSLASEGVRIAQQRISATSSAFSPDALDELIEDLYGMIDRFLRYSPTIVVKSQTGIRAVIHLLVPVFSRIRRSETIDAVSAFAENIVSGEWTHSIDIGTVTNDEVMTIRQILHEIAPVLVEELISLLVSVCNRPMRQAIPSLLMAINQFDPNNFKADWIIRGLRRIPVNIMTDRDKEAAVHSLSNLEDERGVSNCVEDILYRSELVARRLKSDQPV